VTEKELLEEIKRDPSAFAILFNLYYKPIFSYIYHRTGHFEDSVDIAAESFYKAFKNIKYYSYKGVPVKSWLYRIATNEMYQYFRNLRKTKSTFPDFSPEETEIFKRNLQEDKTELEAALQNHQLFLTIRDHLKKLPLKYQEVIGLKYFEGKDNKEIAEILNLKEGTLKSLLSRGLEKLRQKCDQK
jgi:RNA polymerase sigma-70 factor (ECF subfamily)